MPSEKTIVSGIVERIGYDNAAIIFKYDGQKFTENHQILNHKVAVEMVIHGLLERKNY